MERYNEFIDKLGKTNFSKRHIDVITEGFNLREKIINFNDLESVVISSDSGTIDYECVFPYKNKHKNYLVNVFTKAVYASRITPEDMLEKVLPKIFQYIPQTIVERNENPERKISDYTYPGAIIAMKVIEENTPIKVDYNWKVE
jgi:hypothetical protein